MDRRAPSPARGTAACRLGLAAALLYSDVEAGDHAVYFPGGQANLAGLGQADELPEADRGPAPDAVVYHGDQHRDGTVSGGDGERDRLIPSGIVWMQGESDAAHTSETAGHDRDDPAVLVAPSAGDDRRVREPDEQQQGEVAELAGADEPEQDDRAGHRVDEPATHEPAEGRHLVRDEALGLLARLLLAHVLPWRSVAATRAAR